MRNSKNSPDINELIDALGFDRATELCETLGGGQHYVPQNPASRLVHFLTADEMRELRQRRGGETVVIPKAQPVVISRLYYLDGLNVPAIAARLGVHISTVQKNIAAGPHPLVAARMRAQR